MASASIIQLEPKSKSGKRKNVEWSIQYSKATKRFNWTVTVYVEPQVFTGDAQHMSIAEAEVTRILQRFK